MIGGWLCNESLLGRGSTTELLFWEQSPERFGVGGSNEEVYGMKKDCESDMEKTGQKLGRPGGHITSIKSRDSLAKTEY